MKKFEIKPGDYVNISNKYINDEKILKEARDRAKIVQKIGPYKVERQFGKTHAILINLTKKQEIELKMNSAYQQYANAMGDFILHLSTIDKINFKNKLEQFYDEAY